MYILIFFLIAVYFPMKVSSSKTYHTQQLQKRLRNKKLFGVLIYLGFLMGVWDADLKRFVRGLGVDLRVLSASERVLQVLGACPASPYLPSSITFVSKSSGELVSCLGDLGLDLLFCQGQIFSFIGSVCRYIPSYFVSIELFILVFLESLFVFLCG